MPTDHARGCILDAVHWLRHAPAATRQFVAGVADPPDLAQYDQVSAEGLTDSLANFVELPD
jgi:hypothetical protein